MDTENDKSIIQFTDPELIESIFLVNGDFDINKSKAKKQNMSIKPVVETPHDSNDEKRETVISLSVTNFDEIKFEKSTPYLIRVTMKATFKWEKGLTDEEENNLLNVNAASLLLSYIRPLVSQLTGMSRFNTQSIPFIDFTTGI